MTYPVMGQRAVTSVFGLAEQAQVFGLTMARRRFSGLTFAGQGSHLSLVSDHYAGVDSRLFHPSGDLPVDYQGGAIRYSGALAYVDHVLDTSTMSRLREINAESSFSVLG